LQGRLVMSSTIVNSGTIDLSTLNHGLYFVAVVGLDGSALRKTICR
ncbi:MAG: T9SS C-terminal target domain-containing protein, partial [Ignavibacteriae bacterium]